MKTVKVIKGSVGRAPEGAIVDAAVYGDDLPRLLELGVVEMSSAPATVDAFGEPIKEESAEKARPPVLPENKPPTRTAKK